MKTKIFIIVIACFFSVNVTYADRASMQTYFNSNAIKTVWFNNFDDWTMNWVAGINEDSSIDNASGHFPTKDRGQKTDFVRYATGDQSNIIHSQSPIRDFGSNYCADGKCMSMSRFATTATWNSTYYSYKNNLGPDNVFLYFGDGDKDTDGNPCNYQEVYMFFRMYFPIEHFPTEVDSGNVMDRDAQGAPYMKHDSGHNLAEITSNKWVQFLSSRINARDYECQGSRSGSNCPSAGTTIGGHETYRYNVEDQERWVSLDNLNDPSRQLQVKHAIYDNSTSSYDSKNRFGRVDVSNYLNKVIGVEIHAKVETNPGTSTDGIYEVWFYDEKGIATRVLYHNSATLMDESSDGSGNYCDAGFNSVFFNSNWRSKDVNKDLYYVAGEGMHASVYYDDIILSESRVGPTYYDKLGFDQSDSPSSPPKNAKITN